MNRRQLKDRVETLMKRAEGEELEVLTALWEELGSKSPNESRISSLQRQAGL